MKKASAGTLALLCVLIFLSCGQENKSADTTTTAIVEIKASSTLAHKDNKYVVIHVVDRQTDTSWVEGKTGDGIGESITIILSKKTKIKNIQINNGYWEEKYWSMNNRVKDIKIISDSGSSLIQTLKDIPGEQTITLPEEWEVKELTFLIQSVYPGSKWQDTALTEIIIGGIENSEVAKIADTSQPADTAESTDSSKVASADEDAAERIVQAAEGEDSFPITIWAEGFTFTLYEDGSVTAEGSGMAQCDMKFVEGTWDYTEDDKKLISYIVLQQQNCFDYEDEIPEPDWKEVGLQTLIE